ncbi:MAG: hypothetical protein U9O56_02990 [Campylobacterota bacterium]|nr:hypothetical protein [Campylobacterota bacterium]
MYKSQESSIFKKHTQILNQVQSEVDDIVFHIEYLGEYVKDEYPFRKKKLLMSLIRV